MDETNGELDDLGGAGDLPPEQRWRATFLAILLIAFLGGGFFLFLVFASGGFFFYVLLVAGAIGLFGALHYVLWGRGLDHEMEREREEMEREEEEHAPHYPATPPPWERRF